MVSSSASATETNGGVTDISAGPEERKHQEDAPSSQEDATSLPERPLKRRRLEGTSEAACPGRGEQGHLEECGGSTQQLPCFEVARPSCCSATVHDDDRCAICLVQLLPHLRYRLPSCGHEFHAACLLRAFRRLRSSPPAQCPLC